MKLGFLVAVFAALLAGLAVQASEQDDARQILSTSGVKGGLVVHLRCGDGRLTAALHANDSYLVQGIDHDITAARQNIQSTGLYGNVNVASWNGPLLPY